MQRADNNNFETEIMYLVNRILPYRRFLWSIILLKILSGILVDEYAVLFPYGNGVGEKENCPIPDLCYQGYAPHDVGAWYDVIGSSGRLRYLQIVAMDFLLLMPMYLMFLLLEISFLTTRIPNLVLRCLLILPFATVLFDVIETGTHGYGVVRLATVDTIGGVPWLAPPSETWLKVVSIATQMKFLCLLSSVGLIVLNTMLNGLAYLSIGLCGQTKDSKEGKQG
eukprot:jgi/Psemu1/288374/fgenesh1_pg.257_\